MSIQDRFDHLNKMFIQKQQQQQHLFVFFKLNVHLKWSSLIMNILSVVMYFPNKIGRNSRQVHKRSVG